MATPNTTYEILKACYTANGLSVLEPNTEFEVFNAVYSNSDQALRVSIDNLPSGETNGGLPYEKIITSANIDGTQAIYTGIPNGCTTEITITSVDNGITGISLAGDGVSNINLLISNWNSSKPTKELILSSGDGTQILASKSTIVLIDGQDTYILVNHSLNSKFVRVTVIGKSNNTDIAIHYNYLAGTNIYTNDTGSAPLGNISDLTDSSFKINGSFDNVPVTVLIEKIN